MMLSARQVFLVDGLGGVLTATLLGLVLPMFHERIGLGPWTLRWLGLAGLGYAVFSLSTYLRSPLRMVPYLRVIILANLAYCVTIAVVLVANRAEVTVLGFVYFAIEVGVILTLVGLETRILRRAPMSLTTNDDQQDRLRAVVRGTPWMMQALRAVRSLDLPWCIGAGAVRNLVWDALHELEPAPPRDIDVAFFDAAELAAGLSVDLSEERDKALETQLRQVLPDLPWEVCNQAAVHLWFESVFGHPVAPLRSLEEAVASWPEYATSVGIRLEEDDSLTIIAPHGLDDLFACVVRRNPTRVSPETYRQRCEQKRYAERWPRVRIVA